MNERSMAARKAWRWALASGALLLVAAWSAGGATSPERAPAPRPANASDSPVATFSIVGYDPETGDLGIAVESKFFGVGAVVPWARAGVGAVATQSYANTTYGPRGLELLAAGAGAQEAVDTLVGDDDGRAQRQLGIVDAAGRAASYTGDACLAWAGGVTGEHYAAQGNILAGPAVVDAMAAAFETTRGDLATRLMTALAAGQAAGGDARGRQSAALLVVRDGGGYGGHDDRYIDLRVDDHPTPIVELRRLLDMRHGQIAQQGAGRALREGRTRDALEEAARAVRLYPADSTGWLLLAGARLAAGDPDGAVEAGREALLRDPWIKTAVVEGIYPVPVVERLLELEDFARLWESVPTR